MVKYSGGVQQMGSHISVRELGYTQESASRNRAPRSFGLLENPILGPREDCWRGQLGAQ